MNEAPALPKPAQSSQWATSWDATIPAQSIKPPSSQVTKTPKEIKIEEIISKGNRTLGFKPMSRRRIDQFQTDHTIKHLPPKEREEAAKRLAIKDFLKNEMLMDDETIDNLGIQRTFFPRNGDSKILYVQFTDAKQRATITNKSNLLQPNEEYPSLTPKLVKYIPPELYNRFKALEAYSYELRNNESNPLSTNIRFGIDDLELRVRPSKSNPKYDEDFKPDPWHFIQPTPLPDLPAIDLNRDRKPAIRLQGRRLIPTPPQSPIPVPEELLTLDTEASNHQEDIGPVPRQQEDFFKKPLPVRHSTFPSALNTERQLRLQSSSDSSQLEENLFQVHNSTNMSCQ